MYNNSEYPVADVTAQPKVSRRDFFQQAVRGATAVSAGAFSAITMSSPVQAQYGGGPYVWKSIAYYRDYPNGPQFCGRCVHFRAPAGCQIVEPPISPNGWCRYFYPQSVGFYRRRAAVGPGY
jgi:hypothetical protein